MKNFVTIVAGCAIVLVYAQGVYAFGWDTNVGEEDSPIKVKSGEIGTAEIKASPLFVLGEDKIEISHIGCDGSDKQCIDNGAMVEDFGDGKAKVTWDTKGKEWLSGNYWIEVLAVTDGTFDLGKKSLEDKIWFKLEGGAVSKDETSGDSASEGSTLPTTSTVDAWISSQYGEPLGYSARGGAIPKCAFSGTCRNINNLLELIINFASGMFAIIGSFAFAFFVYGGFKMIVSMGSPEKVKSGKDAMIAAVIGMVIAFAAYAAINLLLTTLGVEPDSGFREIK